MWKKTATPLLRGGIYGKLNLWHPFRKKKGAISYENRYFAPFWRDIRRKSMKMGWHNLKCRVFCTPGMVKKSYQRVLVWDGKEDLPAGLSVGW